MNSFFKSIYNFLITWSEIIAEYQQSKSTKYYN